MEGCPAAAIDFCAAPLLPVPTAAGHRRQPTPPGEHCSFVKLPLSANATSRAIEAGRLAPPVPSSVCCPGQHGNRAKCSAVELAAGACAGMCMRATRFRRPHEAREWGYNRLTANGRSHAPRVGGGGKQLRRGLR